MRVIRRGVTLVELLVVAFVVSVLLLITVPVIRHFKVKQDDLVNIRNMGATMQDFFAWAADRQSIAPTPGRPDQALVPSFYGPHLQSVPAATNIYLALPVSWPRLMKESGFNPSQHWHSTSGPDDVSGQIDLSRVTDPHRLYQYHSRYLMTYATLFTDDLWQEHRTSPIPKYEALEYAKAVGFGSIRFPARKGILAHTERRHGDTEWHVGFADGHAKMRSVRDAMPGSPTPWSATLRIGKPVVQTIDGYSGFDF